MQIIHQVLDITHFMGVTAGEYSLEETLTSDIFINDAFKNLLPWILSEVKIKENFIETHANQKEVQTIFGLYKEVKDCSYTPNEIFTAALCENVRLIKVGDINTMPKIRFLKIKNTVHSVFIQINDSKKIGILSFPLSVMHGERDPGVCQVCYI